MTTRSGARKYDIRAGLGRVVLVEIPQDLTYHVPPSENLPQGGVIYLPSSMDHGAVTCRVVTPMEDFRTPEGEILKPIYDKDSIVILGKFTGTRVTLDRTVHIICREADIICELRPVLETSDEAQKEKAAQPG